MNPVRGTSGYTGMGGIPQRPYKYTNIPRIGQFIMSNSTIKDERKSTRVTQSHVSGINTASPRYSGRIIDINTQKHHIQRSTDH